METRDDLYMYKEILNNLLLLKVAHRAGLDMNAFDFYIPDDPYGFAHSWDLFTTAVSQLFEECDFYGPYDDSVQNEKEYWLNLVQTEKYESNGVVVLLDDRIQPFKDAHVGGYTLSDWYTGYAEISWIKNGIVINYNEDDGSIDWTDVFAFLVDLLNKVTEHKESVNYEVAV